MQKDYPKNTFCDYSMPDVVVYSLQAVVYLRVRTGVICMMTMRDLFAELFL